MQPLSKAMRRRLKRLAPELSEEEIDRFERDRRAAMQAALLEDPLYAAALGAGPELESPSSVAMRAAPPIAAPEPRDFVRRLGALLQQAADAERQSLDRKADRALARQGEAARPKRPLARRATEKKASAKKTSARKATPKGATRKPGKKPPRKPLRRGPRGGR